MQAGGKRVLQAINCAVCSSESIYRLSDWVVIYCPTIEKDLFAAKYF